MQGVCFMVHIGIFENKAFTLSRSALKLTNCALTTNPKNAKLDIALISGTLNSCPFPITSNIVIAPDSLKRDIFSSISANSLISYGLCRRNTVTASSLVGSKLAVSLQRKITDIRGQVLEEQELMVNIENGEFAEETLGIVSLLLALGVSSRDISKLHFSF